MLCAKFVREGFKVNVKVVEQIYREERLWLRRTKRKKVPKAGRKGRWCPIAANQRWSLDFTSDALANGRKFQTANLKDDCTRECPATKVDLSLPGERVVELLNRVARERGYGSLEIPVVPGKTNDPSSCAPDRKWRASAGRIRTYARARSTAPRARCRPGSQHRPIGTCRAPARATLRSGPYSGIWLTRRCDIDDGKRSVCQCYFACPPR
jgi:hypothetical protein